MRAFLVVVLTLFLVGVSGCAGVKSKGKPPRYVPGP